MRFYVKYETAQEGPFDLLSMIRKIRNGQVTADLLVLEEREERAVPASVHPQLAEFFQETGTEHPTSTATRPEAGSPGHRTGGNLSFFSALKRGVQFLIAHQFSAVYSAGAIACCLMLAAILTFIFPPFMEPLAAILSWIFFQFLLGALTFLFLRQHRGQMRDPASLLPFFRRSAVPLIFCSALVGIFSAIGGLMLVAPGMITLILTIPGVVALALYSFAPLLIVDKNIDFWEAMELSRKNIFAQGRPLFEVVFGFSLLNVLAGFLYVLPLAITLPLTYGALADIFDEMDFH